MVCGKSISRSIRNFEKRAESLNLGQGKIAYEENDQTTRTCFLAQYVGLSLYDIYFQKKYYIFDEEIQFVKVDGYALFGNPYHPDGT